MDGAETFVIDRQGSQLIPELIGPSVRVCLQNRENNAYPAVMLCETDWQRLKRKRKKVKPLAHSWHSIHGSNYQWLGVCWFWNQDAWLSYYHL